MASEPDSVNFYLFDFALRYPVARCASDDSWAVAIMSLLTITSAWAWVAGFVLAYFQVRCFFSVRGVCVCAAARVTFFLSSNRSACTSRSPATPWLLTLVHLVLVFGFHQPPPVAGCGPVHSFPSSQTTLSSYALGVFWFYQVCARRGRSDSLARRSSSSPLPRTPASAP